MASLPVYFKSAFFVTHVDHVESHAFPSWYDVFICVVSKPPVSIVWTNFSIPIVGHVYFCHHHRYSSIQDWTLSFSILLKIVYSNEACIPAFKYFGPFSCTFCNVYIVALSWNIAVVVFAIDSSTRWRNCVCALACCLAVVVKPVRASLAVVVVLSDLFGEYLVKQSQTWK